MAGISTKSIYGLAAMFELSKHYGSSHIQIKEISLNLGIPQNYLEQLLSTLRKAGLVESVRGAGGGYKLARDPGEICCCDIVEALDGDVWRVENPLSNEALKLFWDERSEMGKGTYALSLKELLGYEEKAAANLVYYI
ncbi:MAG: Rrf2 family transcriptional regulator [Campylobacterales bacterium]|nr:Rrf2 family transcriptional regulator [Campylobacterales bacterium]